MLQIDPLVRNELANNFPFYAKHCLKIRAENGDFVQFVLNLAQLKLHEVAEKQLKEKGFVRILVLKGRKMGSTTLINGRGFHKATHNEGIESFILTHSQQATSNLFDMAKCYYEYCPLPLKPTLKASNSKELIFAGLRSGYKLGTAGNKSVGRSHTIQFLHASEAAFFQHADEHAKGILQAVPREKGTEIWIESTANGMGNWFHNMWLEAVRGESDYIPVFIPWFWDPKYSAEIPEKFELTPEEVLLKTTYGLTDAQLAWRRVKIREFSVLGSDGINAFHQEYPCCAEEAFVVSGAGSFIDPLLVMRARKNKHIEPYGPLVIGVDPAWDKNNSDRTAFVWRRGRVIEKYEVHKKKDNMAIVGLLHEIILRDKPVAVNIDVGGGTGIIDRLIELKHGDIVNAINFGSKAIMSHKYANRRTEMYCTLQSELESGELRIPDDDEYHSDLCAAQIIGPNSGGLQQLEPKTDIKGRHGRSPDLADATVLTWAIPIAAFEPKASQYVFVNGTQLKVG